MKQVITFHYTLTDKEGKTLDSSRGAEPLSFLEGSGQIIPGLEEQLMSLKEGDKKEIHVPYPQAYGAYDQKLIFRVGKEKFPKQDVVVGDMFQVDQGGSQQIVTVIEVLPEQVVLDANHPLAGKDLKFDVELMEKREATPEELDHGHAHGEGGHHHH